MKTGPATDTYSHRRGRLALAGAALLAACVAVAVGPARAPAQSTYAELSTKQSQLADKQGRAGVLSTEISSFTSKIETLSGQVAALRNREAAVAAELKEKQRLLDEGKKELEILRGRLERALDVLAERLVGIYKSDEPDAVSVVLEADGFGDLLERYEYLSAIQDQDTRIATRVHDLHDKTQDLVQAIREARNTILSRKRELTRTRSRLESQEAALSAARSGKAELLAGARQDIERLEGDIEGLEGQIQSQLGSYSGNLPAGPIRGGRSGFIWPVNGPVVSGYGMRWGRLHAGIDIAVGTGTPIRAAKAGSIAFSGAYGGYGNYTCIAHGGGLSTCYAHQSRFARTSGSVSQGTVIGYVGCTGHCFGPHLHFEVRVNGSPVDPMGYL